MTLRIHNPDPVSIEQVVSVLGPERSFSHTAYAMLERQVGGIRHRFMASMDEAHDRLSEGNDAILPTENFSSSEVGPNIDLLFDFTNGPNDPRAYRYLEIRGGVLLAVRMCLGGTDRNFRQGHTVVSQEMGLKQCRKFLRTEMPNLRDKKRANSTAQAVEIARQSEDPGVYAIASDEAIRTGGLTVVRDGISNAEMQGGQNGTRFLWLRPLHHEPLLDADADYHACIMTPKDEKGMLSRMTDIIDRNGGNLHMEFRRPIGIDKQRFFYAWKQQGGDVRQMYDDLESLPSLSPKIPVLLHMGSWYSDTDLRDPGLHVQ